MTVRNDISVDFNVSPRIITVAAPSTEITIQDLHDTLRTIEDDVWNMSFRKLINSFGKQPLGGGVLVGITSELQNAKLKFADRSGPSWIICTISGGNLVAVDADGVEMDPVEPSAYVNVVRASSSSATLINDLSKTDVSTAVWDEGISVHSVVGSFGKRMIDVLKLKRIKP